MSNNKVSYVRKKFAKRSIICMGLMICALGLFLISLSLATNSQGQAGLNAGALGFCSLLLSLVGIWYGVRSFSEKEKNCFLARAGIGIGGILVIIWVVLIIIGFNG